MFRAKPPELAADILERGIIVAGGSLLQNTRSYERTNVPVNVAEDPLLSVVKGTGMVLENLKNTRLSYFSGCSCATFYYLLSKQRSLCLCSHCDLIHISFI